MEDKLNDRSEAHVAMFEWGTRDNRKVTYVSAEQAGHGRAFWRLTCNPGSGDRNAISVVWDDEVSAETVGKAIEHVEAAAKLLAIGAASSTFIEGRTVRGTINGLPVATVDDACPLFTNIGPGHSAVVTLTDGSSVAVCRESEWPTIEADISRLAGWVVAAPPRQLGAMIQLGREFCPVPVTNTLDAECEHAMSEPSECRITGAVSYSCERCLGVVTFDLWD